MEAAGLAAVFGGLCGAVVVGVGDGSADFVVARGCAFFAVHVGHHGGLRLRVHAAGFSEDAADIFLGEEGRCWEEGDQREKECFHFYSVASMGGAGHRH